MQDSMKPGEDCLFFLADLHALSQPVVPAELTSNSIEMAATLLACGIDPDRAILFNQARVPAHSELAWILGGTARMGWLNRMTQWKDKAGKSGESQSVALFTYPVLQAADVLLYQATHVPVGEDQKQHLELARDVATKFNNDYGVELFTLPEPFISKAAPRIMSLRDGSAKMSKSDPSDASRINLVDSDDMIVQKLKKAKTDPEPLPATFAELAERPEAKNLVTIYSALADTTTDAVMAEYGGKGFGAFKPALADLAVAKLGPIRDRLTALLDDRAAVGAALAKGGARANAIAAPTLLAAQRAVGLHV
jgi:tryptophanyl-tRNA synthetase